jgi:hypothetical protein
MSDEKTYEMLWDCKFCGTKKLLGKTHRFCPNCGAAQDPATRYYPSDEEKVAVEDHVYVGEDRICAACGTLNSASAEFCMQCGAPLSDAARAQRLTEQSRAEGEAFASSGSRDVAKEEFDAEMQRVGLQAAPGAKRGGLSPLAIGLIVVGVLVVIGVLVALFWKQDASVYVTGHSWERTIQIEQFGPQPDSAWCDSMPGGAYSISRRTEQRSSRQVPDGEDCRTVRTDQGDGTFTERRECTPRYRSEPIYDDRCYFTINRWSLGREARASGDSVSDTPMWPDTNIQNTGTCIGCEREGGRSETYRVMLRAGEANYVCTVPLERWQAMPIESTWRVDVGVISGQPDCNSIEPAG